MPKLKQNDKFAIALGQKIRRLRQEFHMTQKELAEEIGVSENQVSKFEMGSNCPGVYRLLIICRALEIDIGEMLEDLKL